MKSQQSAPQMIQRARGTIADYALQFWILFGGMLAAWSSGLVAAAVFLRLGRWQRRAVGVALDDMQAAV